MSLNADVLATWVPTSLPSQPQLIPTGITLEVPDISHFLVQDAAVALLRKAAALEHALMVQYLYAAYSLADPAAVPEPWRGLAGAWEDELVRIAREEMAHLITVQNLLLSLGDKPALQRDDPVVGEILDSIHFSLEPPTREWLSRFVVAEMPYFLQPTPELEPALDGVLMLGRDARRVGGFYLRIYCLFAPCATECAQLKTLAPLTFVTGPPQAEADDWSREDMIIFSFDKPDPVKAALAIRHLMAQGEGLYWEEPSHFTRFLEMYRRFPVDGPFRPGAQVPVDPTTYRGAGGTYIEHPTSRRWAELFNLRYTLLLHALQLFLAGPGPLYENTPGPCQGDVTPRGLLRDGCFHAMAVLRYVGRLLPRLPLYEDPAHPARAGAPFKVEIEPDRASTDSLKELLERSLRVTGLLLEDGGSDAPFLRALQERDRQSLEQVAAVAGHLPLPHLPRGFNKVKQILEDAVRGAAIPVHGNFWRVDTEEQLIGRRVLERPLIVPGDPEASLLIRALRGHPPFTLEDPIPAGQLRLDPKGDVGRDSLPRMPYRRPAVPECRIQYLERWIAGL